MEGIETIMLNHGKDCEPTVVSIDTSLSTYPYKIHFNERPATYRAKCCALALLTHFFHMTATRNRQLYESVNHENLILRELIEELRIKIRDMENDPGKGIRLVIL